MLRPARVRVQLGLGLGFFRVRVCYSYDPKRASVSSLLRPASTPKESSFAEPMLLGLGFGLGLRLGLRLRLV